MGFFFGRDAELARLSALEREPSAVIYGVVGIGKTELAHRAIAAVRASPPAREVTVVGIEAPRRHLLDLAYERITGREVAAPLPPLLDLLTREHRVLLIEGAHHAPAEAASLVDGYARRHGASRIVITSQVELPFATTPLTVRLDPFDAEEARGFVRHLAARLGVPIADVDRLAAMGCGHPAVLRQLVLGRTLETAIAPLRDAVDGIPPDERAALATLAAIAECSRSRIVADRLVSAELDQALARRFLVELTPEQIVVPAVVSSLATRDDEAGSLARARRVAAQVLWEDYVHARAPMTAIEAICLALDGDPELALQWLRAAAGDINNAGVDHLLYPLLDRLVAKGDIEASFVAARTCLRMARIDDAARILERIPSRYERDPRLRVIRATIAERRGQLDAAADDFLTAIAHTAAPRQRVLKMRLAAIRAMAGHDDDAAALLREIEDEREVLPDHELARLHWVRAVVHALHQAWDEALAAIVEGRRAAARANATDLDYLLLMLELQASSERGDLARVEMLGREVTHARPSRVLRERMSGLYVGISQLALGHVDEAIATLGRAYRAHQEQRDLLLASLTGHYLGRALLVRGDAAGASEVLRAVAELAMSAGQVHLVGPGQTYLARALLSMGRVSEAMAIAEPLTTHASVPVATAALAVLAYGAALAGQLCVARRHLAQAFTRAGDQEPERSRLLLDQAEVELLGGESAIARTAASTVLADLRASPHARARALIVAAGSDLADGHAPRARSLLDEAKEVASRWGFAHLCDRATLIQIATTSAAEGIVERVPAEHRPGIIAMLRFLGLRPNTVITSARFGRFHGEPEDLLRIAAEHDISIDVEASSIMGRSGIRVEGQSTAIEILVALAESPEPLSAARLYHEVWGGAEYHPLRHRNTLYVALNRTRKLVREIGERRTVIVRLRNGWTIAEHVTVAIARKDPRTVPRAEARAR